MVMVTIACTYRPYISVFMFVIIIIINDLPKVLQYLDKTSATTSADLKNGDTVVWWMTQPLPHMAKLAVACLNLMVSSGQYFTGLICTSFPQSIISLSEY